MGGCNCKLAMSTAGLALGVLSPAKRLCELPGMACDIMPPPFCDKDALCMLLVAGAGRDDGMLLLVCPKEGLPEGRMGALAPNDGIGGSFQSDSWNNEDVDTGVVVGAGHAEVALELPAHICRVVASGPHQSRRASDSVKPRAAALWLVTIALMLEATQQHACATVRGKTPAAQIRIRH